MRDAVTRATTRASEQALAQAFAAGADEPQVRCARRDNVAELAGGETVFLESEIVATAVGRPRLSQSALG